jgi:hypothetical protein
MSRSSDERSRLHRRLRSRQCGAAEETPVSIENILFLGAHDDDDDGGAKEWWGLVTREKVEDTADCTQFRYNFGLWCDEGVGVFFSVFSALAGVSEKNWLGRPT